MNKIQRFLIANYPTVWNVKLVPMLFLFIIMYFLFGLLGYLMGNVDFSQTYYRYYSSPIFERNIFILLSLIFIRIFIFIGWLVFYMRNNRLGTFYPAKTKQLYGEWILGLIIITLTIMLPHIFDLGSKLRTQSIASKQEVKAAFRTLQMAKILIPNNYSDYQLESDVPIEKSDSTRMLKEIKQDSSRVRSPRLSLLNYGSHNVKKKYGDYDNDESEEINTVRQWLLNGRTDSIRAVMEAFYQLQHKHNLNDEGKTLTPDQWFERIYTPPFFEVNKSNLIMRSYDYNFSDSFDESYDPDKNSYYLVDKFYCDTLFTGDYDDMAQYYSTMFPTLPYEEIKQGYRTIDSSYDYNSITDMLSAELLMALLISIAVFSVRLTNGNSFLKAFIISGLLLIFFFLWDTIIYTGHKLLLSTSAWFIIFVVLSIYLSYHTFRSQIKGKSKVAVNTFMWLIPFLIPIIFKLLCIYDEATEDEIINNNQAFHFYYYEDEMMWINILFVLLIMYPVIAFLRRWKGLAEE